MIVAAFATAVAYAIVIASIIVAWRDRVRMLGRHHRASRFPKWAIAVLAMGMLACAAAGAEIWWRQ